MTSREAINIIKERAMQEKESILSQIAEFQDLIVELEGELCEVAMVLSAIKKLEKPFSIKLVK